MTQKDKELLLKDLCARLPYGVCCKHTTWDEELGEVEVVVKIYSVNHDGYVRNCCDDETVYIDEVKPYLFPMSSMTDEQKDFYWNHSIDFDDAWTEVDWLNAHHFDYRGLIEKGLALDATGLNIYKMK